MTDTLDGYQDAAFGLAIYPDCGKATEAALTYAVVGLVGEAGELANKWKKVLRGDKPLSDEVRLAMASELGGVLWYVAAVATELGLPLASVAGLNLAELYDRKATGTLQGDGDARGQEAVAQQAETPVSTEDAYAAAQLELPLDNPPANPEPETVKPANPDNMFATREPLSAEQQEENDSVTSTFAASLLGFALQNGTSPVGATAMTAQVLAQVVARCVKPTSLDEVLADLNAHIREHTTRLLDHNLRTTEVKGNA